MNKIVIDERSCCSLPTKGFESQLTKLGIEILEEHETRLPIGLTIEHYPDFTLILTKDARMFDGTGTFRQIERRYWEWKAEQIVAIVTKGGEFVLKEGKSSYEMQKLYRKTYRAMERRRVCLLQESEM